jgi:iron complex outermembrane receptor protein
MKTMACKHFLLASSALVFAAYSGSGAFAQSASPATVQNAAPATSTQLQEVVVTAQRRAENLERTPVAVSVVSGDALTKQGIASEADLQSAVPGLTIRGTADSNQLNYALRGQSVDAFSTSPPAVLPYVNEVATNNAGSSAFYDLQSVQVLKGPQGTLFGRNGTGGAVLFTTTKPTDIFGGYVSAKAGDYGLGSVEGAVNLPIVDDKLLLRVAAFSEHQNGFQHNLFNNTTVGTENRNAVRISLTAKLSDKLKNDLVLDYGQNRGSSMVPSIYSVGGTPFIPAPVLFSPILDAAVGFPGAWNLYLSQHPGAYAGGLTAFAALQKERGPYNVDIDGPLSNRDQNLIVSDITTYDLSSDIQIKNVFGYVNSQAAYRADIDGTPYGIESTGQNANTTKNKQFTEELQLLGKAFSKDLSYVVGAYYLNNTEYYDSPSTFLNLTPIISPASAATAADLTDQSYAGYAQGTYNLGSLTKIEGLSVTAGIRYTEEDVGEQVLPGSPYYDLPAPFERNLSQSAGKLSWQFGAQEQLNSNLLLYVVTRRSFRSGGFNGTAAPLAGTAAVGGALFKPETATDVEGGVKIQGDLLGAPARLNLAVYNQWVDDIQRSIYGLADGQPAGYTTNVPAAEVTGFEAEGQINPTSWLKTGASLAYTDARFTDAKTVLFGTPTIYGPYPDAPRWSGSLFAEATLPLQGPLSVSARGDLYAQSSFYFSSLNNTVNPGSQLAGYGLADFRVSLDDNAAGWSVSAYVKNAFNHVYYVGGVPLGSLLGFNTALPGAPRTFYVQIRDKF